MAMLYTHSIGNQRRIRCRCLKCVIVYPARDIRPFVMYCVNEKPRSFLLIESTDSMTYYHQTEEGGRKGGREGKTKGVREEKREGGMEAVKEKRREDAM